DGMHTLSVNTARPELRQQFHQQYLKHHEQLRQMLSRYRIPLLEINCAIPSARQLLGLYGVRRNNRELAW
ncbi:hypothetical protein, partial [Endozoicomonas sp. ONNA2]|uniref:hypothetical protein n=1 Tax=Endozoicomonas sp. ONNA2 TaxID=2828741 RepID=UPI002147C605